MDSAIVNHHFAPPPFGRIIVESLFPIRIQQVANLRISFEYGFFWGVNSSALGDAFFTEMEFVISRCHFDLSKIF